MRPWVRAAGAAVAMTALPLAVQAGWLDRDTPADALATTSLVDGAAFDLVFSDEFQVDGRTFDDGHDPRWTATDKNDYTNTALHYFSKDKLTTGGGKLNITTTSESITFRAQDDESFSMQTVTKDYISGMVQGWDKFCFTGGIIEVRAKLPGNPYAGGLWPAIWILGNLARATYVATSDWVWPWSYDECNRDLQRKQLISECSPNSHFGLNPHQGRGAPEIDIMEAMPGWGDAKPSDIKKPYFSASLQVSPGIDSKTRPKKGDFPIKGKWYEGMDYGKNTSQNIFFYGDKSIKKDDRYSYQTDALSGNTQMWGDTWQEYHTWRLEWQAPESDVSGQGGFVKWFLDDELIYGIDGQVVGKPKGAKIPSEPMYVILNTGVSSTWGFPEPCAPGCACDCYDCKSWACKCAIAPGFCESLPAHFLIDYVRVYQNKADPNQKVGCSTPERPTAKFIQGNRQRFMQPGDKAPLKDIKQGGASCHANSDCGGATRGACVKGNGHQHECKCHDGWTGPRCRAQVAFDDIVWEKVEHLGFDMPFVPNFLLTCAAGLLVLFVVACTTNTLRSKRTSVLGFSFSSEPRLSRAPTRASVTEGAEASDSGRRSSNTYGGKVYSMVPVASEVQLSRMVH